MQNLEHIPLKIPTNENAPTPFIHAGLCVFTQIDNFGETLKLVTNALDAKSFYAFYQSFDK